MLGIIACYIYNKFEKSEDGRTQVIYEYFDQ